MKKFFSLISILCCFMSTLNVVIATQSEITEINAAGDRIIGGMIWLGYAVALGMMVFIGIKYMTGAADSKANMKSAIVSWFIGAFIVFGLSTVLAIVTGIFGGNGTISGADIVNSASQL